MRFIWLFLLLQSVLFADKYILLSDMRIVKKSTTAGKYMISYDVYVGSSGNLSFTLTTNESASEYDSVEVDDNRAVKLLLQYNGDMDFSTLDIIGFGDSPPIKITPKNAKWYAQFMVRTDGGMSWWLIIFGTIVIVVCVWVGCPPVKNYWRRRADTKFNSLTTADMAEKISNGTHTLRDITGWQTRNDVESFMETYYSAKKELRT